MYAPQLLNNMEELTQVQIDAVEELLERRMQGHNETRKEASDWLLNYLGYDPTIEDDAA